jgi:Gram-negative bacterial TonB protein C-terminal
MPWRAPKIRVYVPLVLLVTVAVAQEAPPTVHCVPDLGGLNYPTAAFQANIQGTVNISFMADSNGKASQVESTAHPLLRAVVIRTLEAVTLLPECSGQRISMQINFHLDQDLPPNSPIVVRRVSETAYEVVSPGKWITTTIYDPAYTFTRRGRFLHRVKEWFR